MKKINLIGIILVLLISIVGCSQNQEESSVESLEINTITVENLEKENDIQIIDIRSQDKYLGWENEEGNSGHIPNALDFTLDWFNYSDSTERIDLELTRRGIDKNKKTVIYTDNNISEEAYKVFVDAGFKEIYALEDGINGYIENKGETEKLEGYQRYVSPQWVEDLVNGKNPQSYSNSDYKVVEITLGSEKDVFEKGHIKGAINIDADSINHIAGPRNLSDYELIPIEEQLTFWGIPKDEDIKNVLENAGITKDTTVILYASEKATTAANRTALVMDYAGVKDIRFLNGGKVLWELEGKELETGSQNLERKDFGAEIPQNPEIIYSYEDELNLIKDKNAVIASVRSWNEYLGKESGYTYIGEAGDIENSRFAYSGSNPYAMEDYRNLDNTMFNYKIIADRWEKWGIVPEKTVSFHCGTGWRASETYYIAKALGWENVGVYVGGWYEWTKRENSPVKEIGLPKDAPEQTPMQFFYN